MGNAHGTVDFDSLRAENKSRATVDDQKLAPSREHKSGTVDDQKLASSREHKSEPGVKTGETEASPKAEINHTSDTNGTAPQEKAVTKREPGKVKKTGSWFKKRISSLSESSKKRHARREAERSATAPVSLEGEANDTEAEISTVANTLVESAIAEALASEDEAKATPTRQESSPLPQVVSECVEAKTDEVRQTEIATPQESVPQELVEGQSTPREEESKVPPSPSVTPTTEDVQDEVKEVTETVEPSVETEQEMTAPQPEVPESTESPVETKQEAIVPQSEEPVAEAPPTHVEEIPEPESESSPREDEKPNESFGNEPDTEEIPVVDTNNTNSAETPLPSTDADMDISLEDKPANVETVNSNIVDELPPAQDDQEVRSADVEEVKVNGDADEVTSPKDIDQPLSGKHSIEEVTTNGGDVHDVHVNGE